MSGRRRMPSFLAWAFVLSLAVHVVTLPFLGLKTQAHGKAENLEPRTITIEYVPKPTPPPPTPTPPSPVRTTPPAHRAPVEPRPRPRPRQQHVSVAAVHLSHDVETGAPGERATRSRPNIGTNAPVTPEPAGPVATATIGAPEPSAAPPTETPKPACSKPHAGAAVSDAVEPEYPDAARNAGETGTAEVRVTLDANGRVVDADVQQSSGFLDLDREAVKAARASSYSAEVINCVASAGRYLFTADFTAQ